MSTIVYSKRMFFSSLSSLYYLETLYFSVSFVKSSHWGVEENGCWTGVLGMLQRYDVDFMAQEMFMTIERSEVAHFLTPYRLTK